MTVTITRAALVALVATLATASAGAQDSTRIDSARTTPDGPLVTRRDLIMFAGATLSTAAVAPFDRHVESTAHRADLRHRGVQRAANAFAFTGGPGPFIAGAALYVGGMSAASPSVARFGVTLTEGVVLAATLNGVVKGFAGRALPNAAPGEPGDFSFGRGFHDGNGPFVSFPSGHTAASFAAAAVFADEARSWGPDASRIVAPAAYTTATFVAISRLYANVHWASDLPLGAAIGIWSGKTVATWQRRHPDNWLTRRLLGVGVAPQKHGLAVTAAVPLD
jgi:membrane-associated phospholipid phosphatase